MLVSLALSGTMAAVGHHAVAQEAAPTSPVPGQPDASSAASATAPATSGDAAPDTPAAGGVQVARNLPSNLSPWGMFLAADIVVKAVMIGLAFASLVTWTV